MMEYQNQFFQQLHNFFPAVLYDDRFSNNDLCQYIRQQIQYHEDPYTRNQEQYNEMNSQVQSARNISSQSSSQTQTSQRRTMPVTSPIHRSPAREHSPVREHSATSSISSIIPNLHPTTTSQSPLQTTLFSTFIPLYPSLGRSTAGQTQASRENQQTSQTNTTNATINTNTSHNNDTGIDVTISAAVQDLFGLVGQNMNSFDESLLDHLGLGLGGRVNGFTEPVPVIPSQDVIQRACETMTYEAYIIRMEEAEDDPVQDNSGNVTTPGTHTVSIVHTECPIRQQSFSNDDTITRIRHCGHVFFERELSVWFETHPTCPVCRHDIRQQ